MEIEESVVGIDTGRASEELVAGGGEGRGGAGSRLTSGGPGVGSRGGIGDDTPEGSSGTCNLGADIGACENEVVYGPGDAVATAVL